jgi:hypothetical protein
VSSRDPTISRALALFVALLTLESAFLYGGYLIGKGQADVWWQNHTAVSGACGCYIGREGNVTVMRERK